MSDISRQEVLETVLRARNEQAASEAYARAHDYEEGMIDIFVESRATIEKLIKNLGFKPGEDYHDKPVQDQDGGLIWFRWVAN